MSDRQQHGQDARATTPKSAKSLSAEIRKSEFGREIIWSGNSWGGSRGRLPGRDGGPGGGGGELEPANERRCAILYKYLVIKSLFDRADRRAVHGIGRAGGGVGFGVTALAGESLRVLWRLNLSEAWPAEAGTPNRSAGRRAGRFLKPATMGWFYRLKPGLRTRGRQSEHGLQRPETT